MAQKRRKSSSARKPRLFLASVVVVILVVALFLAALPATGFFSFLVPPEDDQPEAQLEKYYGAIEEALKESAQVRPTTRPDYLPAEVYENLPPFPEDFYYLDEIITFQEGIVDLVTLEDKYYKQPEFFPGWESNGVEYTRNPERGRAFLWGFGTYPDRQGLSTYPGQEFKTATFWRTSWSVQTWQGMEMIPVFPATGSIKGISVNSRDAEKYFTVEIEPKLLLLGPAFPRFDYNWAQKVVVTINVASNTPPGDYLIGVDPIPPPLEAKRGWTLQHKLKYVDGGSTGFQEPYFLTLVTVQPLPEEET